MTEQEAIDLHPEWFRCFEDPSSDDPSIRVTANLHGVSNGFHCFKAHMFLMWRELNPVKVTG